MRMTTRQALPIAAPAALLCALTALSCAGDGTGPGAAAHDRPALAVNVAALNLQGVGDVVWDVEVRNGAGTPAVVWQRRLSSSRYGDGAGSASYVGTCDAGANPNTVRVWVVGVYSAPVTTLGSFAAGSAGDVNGVDVPFQNPTATAPLERTVSCAENTDVEVQFDVALMRPAQQGFFDIAVAFNNIFCSAKFDCCTEDASGTACAADLRLLFDAAGARNTTMVLGLACTAGPRTDVETELYLDPLTLDCTSPSAASFAADITLSPAGPAGNQCTAGAMTGCPAVTEHHGLDADTWLYQLAVYRGTEALTSGGVDAQKVYWNVALGVKRPAIASCWLETRATADDALGTGVVDHGTIAAGAVYPYLVWEVNLATCLAEPLTFGDPAAMVRTEYTRTTDASTGFAYGFGPSLPAGSLCTPECQHGGTCVAAACVCTGTGYSGAACEANLDDCSPNPCLNGGSCADGVNSFTCTCASGYSDPTCATNTNDCAPNPCLNGGSCADGVNAYTCTCAPGYSGPTCATNVNDCSPNPCLNGGSCADGVNAYTCTCAPGYSGPTCALAIGVVGDLTAAAPGAWADGTYATSCETYIRPIAPRVGSAVSGLYRIDPDGTGGAAAFDVYCDMTTQNGGWTQISYLKAGDGNDNAYASIFSAAAMGNKLLGTYKVPATGLLAVAAEFRYSEPNAAPTTSLTDAWAHDLKCTITAAVRGKWLNPGSSNQVPAPITCSHIATGVVSSAAVLTNYQEWTSGWVGPRVWIGTVAVAPAYHGDYVVDGFVTWRQNTLHTGVYSTITAAGNNNGTMTFWLR